jgi:hypothetical protein
MKPDLKKYRWKLRILLVETPSYQNIKYKQIKKKYEKNLYEFHKRFVKMLTHRKKDTEVKIKLIGFDGTVKHTYKSLNKSKIFADIAKMPMGHLRKNLGHSGNKIKPKNLSLYSDYNPKTTTPGLGFKNKEKALHTIRKIRNRNQTYQQRVVNTMIGRAKNHPNQTEEMRDAIKVFKEWKKITGL